jgi:hypothetical protein
MEKGRNSVLIEQVLKALITVASRRESKLFAVMVINSLIKLLSQSYTFLKYIKISVKEGEYIGDQEITIKVPPEIVDLIQPTRIGEVIESIIRLVIIDMKAKAGLYFIREMKENIGRQNLRELRRIGVNLGRIQLEQYCIYARKKEDNNISISDISTEHLKFNNEKDPNDLIGEKIFGFNWEMISSWSYDVESGTYILYDHNQKEFERFNLEKIVNKLTKLIEIDSQDFDVQADSEEKHRLKKTVQESPTKTSQQIEDTMINSVSVKQEAEVKITKKEYQLLELLYEEDIDDKEAIDLLELSMNDLIIMVNNLIRLELMTQSANDEVEISPKGIKLLMNLYSQKKKMLVKYINLVEHP